MLTKKTLRDVYFDFVKLLEDRKKLVVSSEELANMLDTNTLTVNILLKALKNSKDISLIEKGDIYEISPIYRLKDIKKIVESILKKSKDNKEILEDVTEGSFLKEKNTKEVESSQKKEKSLDSNLNSELDFEEKSPNYMKIKLKSNEILIGEFIEEDENILCLDSQKYRYLIYKNNILEKEN